MMIFIRKTDLLNKLKYILYNSLESMRDKFDVFFYPLFKKNNFLIIIARFFNFHIKLRL